MTPPGAAEAEAPALEAAGVTAFWRGLGLPGLVDVHVHFMPANVLAKVWAFFAEGKGGRPWPVKYPLPEASWPTGIQGCTWTPR